MPRSHKTSCIGEKMADGPDGTHSRTYVRPVIGRNFASPVVSTGRCRRRQALQAWARRGGQSAGRVAVERHDGGRGGVRVRRVPNAAADTVTDFVLDHIARQRGPHRWVGRLQRHRPLSLPTRCNQPYFPKSDRSALARIPVALEPGRHLGRIGRHLTRFQGFAGSLFSIVRSRTR
jgi:hypothetical protein